MLAQERVLIFDGAMGTQLQSKNPSVDDFGGALYEGCNEYLCVTRPQWIEAIHASYIEAGADCIETNSFGSMPSVLGEFSLKARAFEISRTAAQLAVSVAKNYDKKIYVVGSVGPGTKLVTLGQIEVALLFDDYVCQMSGLLDGGVDAFLIETAQDIAQVKTAVRAGRAVMKKYGKKVPLMVQVTVELTGTMLVGTDIAAALAVLEGLKVDSVGLNCATGPKEMRPHLQYLSSHASMALSCMPNAGLPQNIDGVVSYPLESQAFAKLCAEMVEAFGLDYIGGCCGTTPQYIKALAQTVGKKVKKKPHKLCMAASLYRAVSFEQEPRPLFIGERTNANGSRLFREALGQENLSAMLDIAKSQAEEGAHLLDVCTAFVSRPEQRDMSTFVAALATKVDIPLVIDSTEVDVIEAALQRTPGRPVINSINLEDGEKKAREILECAREYGAAVIALTIDEEGMAKTREKKLSIAKRLALLARNYGLEHSDLIFDPLTFTLGSGDEEFRKSAIETLEAIALIKKELPGAFTVLGLSNVSFGLSAHIRPLVNSVMLALAVEKGLDMAICNASKIVPLFDLPERGLFEDLIFDRRKEGYDPLKEILTRFETKKMQVESEQKSIEKLEERLVTAIVKGKKLAIIDDLKKALETYAPLEIINTFLLEGMRIVGERFGKGQMQLPFVLESAECMKTAVRFLESFMDKAVSSSRGKIVLATVKGDVHDIGKNLVDIILTNNGFEVANLGIKQPIEAILNYSRNFQPHAIGLSGLLVKSTVIMRQDLEEMQKLAMSVPVILGGAALTRRYVEEDCRKVYQGPVYYAEDAFEGLKLMTAIAEGRPIETVAPKKGPCISIVVPAKTLELDADGRSPWVQRQQTPPTPPFWGLCETAVDVEELFSFLDEFALIASRWKFDPKDIEAKKLLNALKKEAIASRLIEPKAIYGYFRVKSSGEKLIISDGTTFTFPRQESGRRLSICDFFGSGDVLPMQLVTMGKKATEHAQRLYAKNAYSEYFLFHGFATELAEAYAEYLHAKIRRELCIHKKDAPTKKQLFSQGYQGSRYSFGYPACPNLEDNAKILACLQAERIGVTATETGQMVPEQTTCAIVAWHPQARYFSV